MSVMEAPRARMAENAACPGVSKNVAVTCEHQGALRIQQHALRALRHQAQQMLIVIHKHVIVQPVEVWWQCEMALATEVYTKATVAAPVSRVGRPQTRQCAA